MAQLHSTAHQKTTSLIAIYCFVLVLGFPKYITPYIYTAFKMASQAEKGLSIKHNVKKKKTRMKILTQTYG